MFHVRPLSWWRVRMTDKRHVCYSDEIQLRARSVTCPSFRLSPLPLSHRVLRHRTSIDRIDLLRPGLLVVDKWDRVDLVIDRRDRSPRRCVTDISVRVRSRIRVSSGTGWHRCVLDGSCCRDEWAHWIHLSSVFSLSLSLCLSNLHLHRHITNLRKPQSDSR